MKLWLASKNLFLQVGVTAAMLLVIYGLLFAGVEQFLIPKPESVSESLVQALSAHRYAAIPSLLQKDVRSQVSEEQLAALIQSIEKAHQGIEAVNAQGSDENGDAASATLEIQFSDRTQQNVTLPLVKENYLWRVTSIDALSALAGPGS